MFRKVLVVLLQLQFPSVISGAFRNPETWQIVKDWPMWNTFGQVSAISVDTAGDIFVFHRGDVVWDYRSFSVDNIYLHRDKGPIPNETIIVLDPVKGTVKAQAGARMFFMPHGLTVDSKNNIWITDVAMHQVFKFPPLNSSNKSSLSHPEIVLGEAFVPGNDDDHLCKPTDVAVDSITQDFYVSDGYCNSRIIKYDKTGRKLLNWGRNSNAAPNHYMLNVPHGLALAEDQNMLYVADRENNRTVIYLSDSGISNKEYKEEKPIYSVAYTSVRGKFLLALSSSNNRGPGVVTVYNTENGEVVATFAPKEYGFTQPHDLAVSPDGNYCYVAELRPAKVWKFRRESVMSSDMVPQDLKVAEDESRNLISKTEGETSAHDFLGGTLLAIGVVSSVVIITFLIFVFHMYKKKAGYAQYEMRRLILDDEEEIGINVS